MDLRFETTSCAVSSRIYSKDYIWNDGIRNVEEADIEENVP